jgi:formylglycine-generating enzyme required for sulfatase activity
MMCEAVQNSPASRRKSALLSLQQTRNFDSFDHSRNFQDAEHLPVLVTLPVGEFIMGENEGDKFADDTERPAHPVQIASRFALGKFPVTVAEFLRFRVVSNPGSPPLDGSELPIVCVNWHDATAYCEWLTTQTGRAYRLPTEAEWEFACRAGRRSPFCFGDEISTADANFLYDEIGMRVGLGHRTPVETFAPNTFGLHDLHGNICEWIMDTWHPDYNGAPADGTAWIEPGNSRRVIRGGAWDYLPRLLRSSWRDWRFATHRADNIGFRVATGDLRNLKGV